MNSTFRKFAEGIENNVKILNEAMRTIASEGKGVTYVDLYPAFLDPDGRLDKRYTNDGLHLLGPGYVNWARVLKDGGYLR